MLIGRKADEYLVARRIGKDGFGSVYLALQLPILLKCALKVLRDSIQEQPGGDALMAKFRGEAEALARLNHPNIVRLIRFGEFDSRPYLVMELIEGRSLRDEMRKAGAENRAIARPVVDKLMVQMLYGLEAAHALSIVHRDMKPENVLLQSVVGNPWYVRIVDFGLAKFTAAGTHTSVLSGTPAYMAPEQLVGQGIGPATDVYAMGVIAYELLSGRRMYLGESQDSILASKLNPEYCPFDSVDRTGLSEAEVAFLCRATCFKADDRFRSAGAMLEAWQGLQDVGGQGGIVSVSVSGTAGQSTPSMVSLPHPLDGDDGPRAEAGGSANVVSGEHRREAQAFAAGRQADVTPATALGGTLQRSKGLRTAAWTAVALAILAAALVVLALTGVLRKSEDMEAPGKAVAVSDGQMPPSLGLVKPAGLPLDLHDTGRTGEPDIRSAGMADQVPLAAEDVVVPPVTDVRLTIAPDVLPAQAADVRTSDMESPPNAAEVAAVRADSVPGSADSRSARPDVVEPDVHPHGQAGAGADKPGKQEHGSKQNHGGKQDAGKQDAGKQDAGKQDAGKQDAGQGTQVTIRLETVPSGALVYAGNKPIGETPTSLTIDRGERVVLRIERAGFKTQTLSLTGEKDLKKSFELEPDSF